MSNFTHDQALAAVHKDYYGRLSHQLDYFHSRLVKLRELKLRKAMGEKTVYDRNHSSYDKPIDAVIESERQQLRHAVDCVRRARRELWKLNKLQRSMRKRENHD